MSGRTIEEILEELADRLSEPQAEFGDGMDAMLSGLGYPPGPTRHGLAKLAMRLSPTVMSHAVTRDESIALKVEYASGLVLVRRSMALGALAGMMAASEWTRARPGVPRR